MAQPAVTPARDVFSVVGALSQFSEAQLIGLLRARPDLASPRPSDFNVLATRANHWASINACVCRLNRACQTLIDAFCLLPQPTTVTALVRLLNMDLDADDLDATVGQLEGLALVFRTGEEIRLHPQLALLQNPGGLGPPATTLLEILELPTLHAMAPRLGVPARRNKQDMIAAIVEALQKSDVVRRALEGSPAGTTDLAMRLAEHPRGTVPSGTYFLRPDSPLGWMADRGLIVVTDWSMVVMPREVGLALRGGQPFPDLSLRPPVLRWRPADQSAVDHAGVDNALRVVNDIVTILDGWQAAPPKLLKAGGLGIRDVRRAATAVDRTEIDAARLVELAAIADLAGWSEDPDLALPRPAYDDWLELGGAQRWGAIVRAWLRAELHVNLAGATGNNKKPIPPLLARWPEHVALDRRELVLECLLQADVGQAPDLASLYARLTWDAPTTWTGGPAKTPMLISWVLEEAEMLGVCSGGTLTGLGRTLIAGTVEEAVALLERHAPPMTARFVMQADLTAIATGPLITTARTQLEAMADMESAGAATVYRFSEASLRRAFDDGLTAKGILEFLEAHAAKGVPQPLAYLVEDVGRKHGQVRVGSATCYIRCDDPSLLAEIGAARKASKLNLRLIAPTVLVSTASPETVVATLRATGYLPAEEDQSGAIVVRRAPPIRATEGHCESGVGTFALPDPPPGLEGVRALHDSLAAGREPAASATDDQQPDVEEIARHLKKRRLNAVSGSQPAKAPGQPAHRSGSAASAVAPLPFSPRDFVDPRRPTEIARSRGGIVELLELSVEHDWALRLAYTTKRGKAETVNCVVSDVDQSQTIIGLIPSCSLRRFTIDRISWARVLTEAEEDAL